jgi:plasmid stabilization system protein ParE
MVRVDLSPAAKADIREAIRYTRRKWGSRKVQEYRELIEEARQRLSEDPSAGRPCAEAAPDAFRYHIGQRGRRARHVFLYRFIEDGAAIELVRFVYDGSELPDQWPKKRSSSVTPSSEKP